jgi:hypothetical protein
MRDVQANEEAATTNGVEKQQETSSEGEKGFR